MPEPSHRPPEHSSRLGIVPSLARGSPPTPATVARRSDAGVARFTARDAAGLLLVADMYAAQYDLLAAALGVRPDRARAITARWRRAGLAETGRIGPGPGWCWLTRAGMRAAGLRFPDRRPPLARLAHIRAVLAVRLALEAGEPFQEGLAWWHSERRIRTATRPGTGHVPDAEVHWPSVPGSAYPDECWAIEAELTPKHAARTTAIMTDLLTGTGGWQPGAPPGRAARYDHVVYLCAPAALRAVSRAATTLPAPLADRLEVRDLPEGALL